MPQAPSSSAINNNNNILERRLRENDPTLTKLKLVQHHESYNSNGSLEELLESLRRNTHVKYVLVERHFFRSLPSKDQFIAVLQAIGQMTALEEVELWSIRVPLQQLCEAFQHSLRLKRLGFGFVTLEDNNGNLDASALRGHASLKQFYLSDFRLANNASASALDSLFAALSTCRQLEHVEVFQYQQVEPAFTAAGLATLLDSPSLHHLTLRRMGLTAALTNALAHKLTTNTTLRVLNLNENKLGTIGCTALGRALQDNTQLHELDLRKNQLPASGCVRLSQTLMGNVGLEKLNLACNPLDDLGAEQGLALLLQVHPSLQTLELHRTNVTDVGCRSLVETLRHNTTLTALDLSFNDITERTYIAVAEALKINPTLKSINLQVNKKLRVQACEALLTMIQENTVLEQISTLMRVRFEPQEYHQVENVLHQMNLYLKMNQHGRRNKLLQGNATIQEWGNSLLAVQDDLNGLYYLMQANPAMVCHPFLQEDVAAAASNVVVI